MMDLPDWAKREESYRPDKDRDAFISRSLLRMMEMLIYDECVVVGAFYNCAFHFIQDYAHDSGFEYNTYLPEVTWVEAH